VFDQWSHLASQAEVPNGKGLRRKWGWLCHVEAWGKQHKGSLGILQIVPSRISRNTGKHWETLGKTVAHVPLDEQNIAKYI